MHEPSHRYMTDNIQSQMNVTMHELVINKGQ